VIEQSWPSAEAAIHRWVRESTGISATSVYWPNNGLALPEPPAAAMAVTSDRGLTMAGKGEKRTAQSVVWTATVTAGEGTHTLEVLVTETDDPLYTASVTMPADTTIEEARDALLADAQAEFTDLTVAASGDDAITVTGTDDLRVFHLRPSEFVTAEATTGPVQIIRLTAWEIVVNIEFRSRATNGAGTARQYAQSAAHGMRDFDRIIQRCGWRFGTILRNTPSYLDDVTESRHMLDVQLLGHIVDIPGPRPWVRRVRSTLTAGDASVTAIV
jgi:hypothetical protein